MPRRNRKCILYVCRFGLALLLATQVTAIFQAKAAPPPVNTGQILGKVVKEGNGSALSGASVTAYRISPAPTVSATASTGKDGSFTIGGLSSGQYGICVNDGSGALINPCNWVDLATTVTVVDGSATSGVQISMKASSTLNVRVNDAGQFMGKKAGETSPPHVLVGAFDLKGVFHPAVESQKDNSGISYQLSIPQDFPVRMSLYSVHVKLEDDQHNPVPPGGVSQMIVHPSNQSPGQQKSFTFNAIGRNNP